MPPEPPPPERPVEIVMRRVRGRLRIVRRPLPPELEHAPLWARLGFMLPVETITFLTILAVALAAAGGAAFWFWLRPWV